jgi:hypothetical protein
VRVAQIPGGPRNLVVVNVFAAKCLGKAHARFYDVLLVLLDFYETAGVRPVVSMQRPLFPSC